MVDTAKGRKSRLTDEQLARHNWSRYQYIRQSGHDDYVDMATRCEEYFLGGGLQWEEQDRQSMSAANRFMAENNQILPAVQTALGLQLKARVDMDFQPRGGEADADKAEVITKVVRQICDQINYQRKESYMFEDGLIQQRGFLEFRMDFSTNIQGEVVCEPLSPLDVHIDPDANTYEPNGWRDVVITRWLTADDIEMRYGEDKAKDIEMLADAYFQDDQYNQRARFGADSEGGEYQDWVRHIDGDDGTDKTRIYLVIDRQYRQLVRGDAVVLHTGEIRPKNTLTEPQLAEALEYGVEMVTDYEQINWTVTCGSTVLFNDVSPYRTMSVIPYFMIFRRGQTRGMVDNLKSLQDILNKGMSLMIEAATRTSNSGWLIAEGSLTNMEPEDMEEEGSKDGLVAVYNPDLPTPEKIKPNELPKGLDILVERAEYAIKTVSGMNDPLQGMQDNAVSGKAIMSRQFMGQNQLGSPFDNLALSRRLCAKKILELIQDFYTDERIVRITDPDTGRFSEQITINEVQDDGSILNDITIGKYDVVITDTPTTATFQETQLMQMEMMSKMGVIIPPYRIVKASSLADKHDIAEEVTAASEAQVDPVAQATAEEKMASARLKGAEYDLRLAQIEKILAETVGINVDALYSAGQTAGTIALNPMVAGLGDQIARSAGFVDKDWPPTLPTPGGPQGVYPAPGGQPQPDGGHGFELPPNTDPTTPAPVPEPGSPATGQAEGIETQKIEAL